jgi:hypothetical protein
MPITSRRLAVLSSPAVPGSARRPRRQHIGAGVWARSALRAAGRHRTWHLSQPWDGTSRDHLSQLPPEHYGKRQQQPSIQRHSHRRDQVLTLQPQTPPATHQTRRLQANAVSGHETLGRLSAYEPLVTFEQEQQKARVVWVNSDRLDLLGGRLSGGRRHPPSVPRHLRGHRGTRARRRACPIYVLTSA